MLSFGRRLSTVFLALALAWGQAGFCGGWMPTAEARMACCSDDGSCPMHKSESEGEGATSTVTQAEADRCCAAAEQGKSAPSPSTLGFIVMLGPVLGPMSVSIPEPEAHAEICRASVPLPTPHVPKHLLLSVFLI